MINVSHEIPIALSLSFNKEHPNGGSASVRDFAIETLREIEVFKSSEDTYGYVFYVLQRS